MKQKKKYQRINKNKTTITLMQYYNFALWLPVILPLFLWSSGISPANGKWFFNLVTFGVLQYIAFAGWTIYKYFGASSLQLKKISFSAPISFPPFYAVGFILAYMVSDFTLPGIDTVMVAVSLSLLAIPVGYCYVVMVHLSAWLLQEIGVIRREFV